MPIWWCNILFLPMPLRCWGAQKILSMPSLLMWHGKAFFGLKSHKFGQSDGPKKSLSMPHRKWHREAFFGPQSFNFGQSDVLCYATLIGIRQLLGKHWHNIWLSTVGGTGFFKKAHQAASEVHPGSPGRTRIIYLPMGINQSNPLVVVAHLMSIHNLAFSKKPNWKKAKSITSDGQWSASRL